MPSHRTLCNTKIFKTKIHKLTTPFSNIKGLNNYILRKIRTSVSPCFYADQNSFPPVVSDVALDDYLCKVSKGSRLIFKFLHSVALKEKVHTEKRTTFYNL